MSAVLGIDLGATNIKAVVASPAGNVCHREVRPSDVAEGPEATLRRVVELAREMRAAQPFGAMGIGVCGPVDAEAGLLHESPVLPGWSNVPVVDVIAEQIDLPVYLENDASCAILGEWWLGAGGRERVVAGVTLGTGIGGGLVLDGAVYRGGTGWGGEFGHVSVASEPLCPCGGRGCLGRLASATATVARYRELGGGDVDGTHELVLRAERGDAHAAAALTETVDHLTRAVRILVNVLNPDVFVLAGGMALWGDPLVHAVQRGLDGTTFSGLDRTPVRAAQLGHYSGALGAARISLAPRRASDSSRCAET